MATIDPPFYDNGVTQATYLASLNIIPNVLEGETEIPFSSSVSSYYSTAYQYAQKAYGTFTLSNLADENSTKLGQHLANYDFRVARYYDSAQNAFYDIHDGMYYAIGNALTGVKNANLPLTLDNFAAQTYLTFQNDPTISLTDVKNSLYQGMLKDWSEATGNQLDATYHLIGGDLTILNQSPPVSPPINLTIDSPDNPFTNVFNDFLSHYSIPGSENYNDNINITTDFLNKFHTYLSTVATIQDPKIPGNVYVDPTAGTNPFTNLMSYESYYNAFVPNPTPNGFKAYMNAFYQQQMKDKGSFSVSQDFSAFANAIQIANIPESSVSETHASSALILNRIIQLLISLISTLQSVGVAQANNLTYLTKFQNAYTALLQQVPTFLANGVGPLGTVAGKPGATQAQQARDQLNSSFNGILSDNLRSLRDVQSNNAKTVQSNINTTNDAVNQQTDMATTFLQQMSQLLGAIFR